MGGVLTPFGADYNHQMAMFGSTQEEAMGALTSFLSGLPESERPTYGVYQIVLYRTLSRRWVANVCWKVVKEDGGA